MSEGNNGGATQELAPTTATRGVPLVSGERGLVLRNLDEMWRFAVILAKSGMAPKDYVGKPDNCFIAIQLGQELGVPPMQSIQNIACINGRPSVWGDLALALVEASGLLEDIDEHYEGTFDKTGKDETYKAVITTKRRGRATPRTAEFSIADAKIAGLWGKAGPWTTNPKRMLQMRARGFNLRDNFPDVLKGLLLAEEAGDIIETTATRAEETALGQRISEAQDALSGDKGESGASTTDTGNGTAARDDADSREPETDTPDEKPMQEAAPAEAEKAPTVAAVKPAAKVEPSGQRKLV